MTHHEILASLEQRSPVLPISDLNSRHNNFCLALVSGKIGFFAPKSQGTPVEPREILSRGGSLKGFGVSPGIASGPVRIVTSVDDARGLSKGDVLVTRMTRPEMG